MTDLKNDDLFERVRLVFHDALSVPDHERETFLNDVCAGDNDLLREVTDLLRYHDRCDQALESPLVPRIGSDLLTGVQLGHYHLHESLGEGGMGVVYRAEDDRTGECIALKVLRSDLSSQTAATRFRLESHTLKRLEGEGIARLLDAGTARHNDRDLSYYAMELIEGQNLRETEIANPRDAVVLLAKICDAVGIAHAHGIIHRDVKPENIIVRRDGRPVVLDFGISRTVDPDGRTTSFVTSTGHVLGTVCYMSPEQLIGDSSATGPHSDVYSLGVLAYELLTGTRPHESGKSDRKTTLTQAGVLLAIERHDAPLASTRRPDLDPALDAILYKALQRRPDERYSNAVAMAADLRAYLTGEKIAAPHQTLLRQGWNRVRRAPRRTMVVSVIAFAVILVAGGTTKVLQDRQEERQVQAGLTELWDVLTKAEKDLRPSAGRTNEGLERAVTNLERSREILNTMPRRPFWPRLRRFVDWRSGEARYFLGGQNHDVAQYHLALAHWIDAHGFTWGGEGTMEGLDQRTALYGDIAYIVTPITVGGRALARAALAQYEERAENQRLAAEWRATAVDLLDEDHDWGFGDSRADINATSAFEYADALIEYGMTVDSLDVVARGAALLTALNKTESWQSRRGGFAASQHMLGQAAFYRWERTGANFELAEAEQRFRQSLEIRGEGSGLVFWDRLALAELRLWEGRRASTAAAAQASVILARQEFDSADYIRGDRLEDFTAASVDLLDAEITAALAGINADRGSPDHLAVVRAESLLVAVGKIFPRSRFPLHHAELQLARVHVLEACEPITGSRTDEIREALAAIESIVPGGIWPALQRRAEAHRR